MLTETGRQVAPRRSRAGLSRRGATGSRVLVVGAGGAFLLLFGLVALHLGQDNNWDLRNYHFVGPWWVFSDHMADYEPGQGQSFFNPLIDLPFHVLSTRLPGAAVTFLMGIATGLSFPFLYLIAREFFTSRAGAFVLAAVGVFAAGSLGEAGTTFDDSLTASLALCALWLVLRSLRAEPALPRRAAAWLWIGAGVVSGAACGLKLINASWAVALVAAPLVTAQPVRRRLRAVLAIGLGSVGGLVVTYGWWGWILWTGFGSPVFPLYNNLFHSPWAPRLSVPIFTHGLGELLLYPFAWTATPSLVSENPFRELSLPIAEALLVAVGLRGIGRLVRERRRVRLLSDDRQRLLIAWVVIGYAVWAVAWAGYRYIIPLEQVSFVVIAVLVRELIGSWLPVRTWAVAVTALIAVCVVTMHPLLYNRTGSSDPYFAVPVPQAMRERPAAILVLGDDPVGFAVPELPAATFTAWVGGSVQPTTKGVDYVRGRLAGYSSFFVMWGGPFADRPGFLVPRLALLEPYGMRPDLTACGQIDARSGTTLIPLQYCRLDRVATTAGA